MEVRLDSFLRLYDDFGGYFRMLKAICWMLEVLWNKRRYRATIRTQPTSLFPITEYILKPTSRAEFECLVEHE